MIFFLFAIIIMTKSSKNNRITSKNKTIKNSFKATKLKKSHHKPGVWRKVQFPDRKWDLWVPNTKDTRRSAVVRSHLRNGRWEGHISKLLKSHARLNSVALDIGALIGTHSYALSDAVGPKGKVYTFEPQPWATHAINKTLKKNNAKNGVVKTVGVSDKTGKIHFCSDSTGGSTICTEKQKRLNSWDERYDIDIVSIDSLKLNNVSVVKIDVEGHEINVLEGAIKTIKRNKPVMVIEVWTKKKGKYDAFKKIMSKLNYNVKDIGSDNFLCTPRSK